MAYGPNIPPMGTSVPHGPIPDVLFPRTPAYITPNSRVDGEMNEGVRDQIARMFREFGFTPKGSYQKLYLEYFDTIPYPWGFRVPDLAKFMGDDAKTGTAFNWFTSLPLNSIDTWVSLEQKFQDYFYNGEVELGLSDLTSLRQKYTETISDYLRRFR
jgi:hypothetical protein